MNKRPLCWMWFCFTVFIGLLEFLGITHGGNPRKNQELQILASEEAYVCAEGLVKGYETKQEISYLYLKSATLAVSAKTFSNQTIRVRMENASYPGIGSRVQVKGSLYTIPEASNPGQFDTELYYRIEGIDLLMRGEKYQILTRRKFPLGDYLWRFREYLKGVLVSLAPDEAGELSAMLLGEKGLLEDETKKNYKLLGIYHILAISGVQTLFLVYMWL
ncbi:MAG: ComEC/Rec2 family competence protein [Ruminococcus sp.]|jgi:competence protein ComEC